MSTHQRVLEPSPYLRGNGHRISCCRLAVTNGTQDQQNGRVKMKSKKVITVLAAVGAVMLASTPAYAGSNGSAVSIDMDSSGLRTWRAQTSFYHDGDSWKVWDTASDGHRAGGSVYWSDSAGNHQIVTWDTSGSDDGVYGSGSYNIPEGVRVTIRSWHQNGSNGTAEDIAYGYATA
ncbi:hypothetical protein V1460_34835 [Streptomyces sp. SCSIO 30461]|uniref:hypothetical protein n=1 Tax=Streptomyces sp. SCSIO 30461 TaxID=3118085 RepID=UPI0030D1993E